MSFLIQLRAAIVAFFLTVCVLLPICILAWPLYLRIRLKIICPVWKFFGTNLMRYACAAKIDIQEDHRSERTNGVPAYGLYIANHQSYIDIPLMATIFQIPPIMKQEVLYIPFFGWAAWASGSLPVSRSKNDSRKKVFAMAKKRLVRDHLALQVYPEGTRSKNGRPKEYPEIRKTLLLFAYNEKLPIVPTSLYGSRGVLTPKGHVNPGRHVGVIVHKEIDPVDFENAEDFCKACWGKVLEGYARMEASLAPLNGN